MDGKEIAGLAGASLSVAFFGKIALLLLFIVVFTMITERTFGWLGRKIGVFSKKAAVKAKAFGKEVKAEAAVLRTNEE